MTTHSNSLNVPPPSPRTSSAKSPSSRAPTRTISLSRAPMSHEEIAARMDFFNKINTELKRGKIVLIHKGLEGEKVMKTVEQFSTSCFEKICCIIPRAIRDICLFISCDCCGTIKHEYYRVTGVVETPATPRSDSTSSYQRESSSSSKPLV
jgi:hypothetical protein